MSVGMSMGGPEHLLMRMPNRVRVMLINGYHLCLPAVCCTEQTETTQRPSSATRMLCGLTRTIFKSCETWHFCRSVRSPCRSYACHISHVLLGPQHACCGHARLWRHRVKQTAAPDSKYCSKQLHSNCRSRCATSQALWTPDSSCYS